MEEGRWPIKQMYDENGVPFYPITHIDIINGDKEILKRMGSTIKDVDLSSYLISPFKGEFSLKILNNFVFNYYANIEYGDGLSFDADKDIEVAYAIPASYRSKLQIIHCSVMSGTDDRVNAWITTDGKLMCRITPKAMYREEGATYNSSVKSLILTGLFVRTGMEDDTNGD